MGAFLFRDATAADKDAVLAFTANTWAMGDYIQWVYDEWLADATGCFLVAVDDATGRVAGIDKLSMLSPSEAWFEGIRVSPEFRGRGLSGQMQRHMIEEARARGARTARLLTALDNAPIHRIAYRDGFAMRFIVRHWELEPDSEGNPGASTSGEALRLREATVEEAEPLFGWWRRSNSWFATDGLLDRGWSFSETTSEEWAELATAGRIFVPHAMSIENCSAPPPVAILNPDSNDSEGKTWHLAMVGGTPLDLPALAAAIKALARTRNVRGLTGLLPDILPLHEAFSGTGYRIGNWAGFALFELRI